MTGPYVDLERAMREPVRQTQPSRDAPWRDNAWLAFWDEAADLVCVVHVSTSPNAGARHSRLTLTHRGRRTEVIEQLDAGTFAGRQIVFDLDNGITLTTAEVSGRLHMEALFAIADYTGGAVFPSVLEGRPLNHYQQAASVSGRLNVFGDVVEISGRGFRDRTWGYRNESASILEYIASQCVFPTYSASLMRFHVADGSDRAEGYILGEVARRVQPFTEVVRGRAGEVLEFQLDKGGGDIIWITVERRLGIFPLPVSPERNTGPTLAAYEEFCVIRDSDGSVGVGIIGVGSRRQIC